MRRHCAFGKEERSANRDRDGLRRRQHQADAATDDDTGRIERKPDIAA